MKFENRQKDPKVTGGRVTALLGEGNDQKAVQRILLRSRALFLIWVPIVCFGSLWWKLFKLDI